MTGPQQIRRKTTGCNVSRSVARTSSGLLRVSQSVNVTGKEQGLDATGRYWMLAVVEIEAGSIEYVCDNETVAVRESHFGIVAPPFSIIEVLLRGTRSRSVSYVSAGNLLTVCPNEPVIFNIAMDAIQDSPENLARHFDRRALTIPVGRCRYPSLLAQRAKSAIDNTFAEPGALSRTAHELGVSASAMSRAFRNAYGLPPVRYRHMIRTMDGMMRLVAGSPISQVFQEIGFDDLSRFYRQFKRYTLSPPSLYKFGSRVGHRSKNAKITFDPPG
jgi:AraC-like DNA-binding protein